MFMFHFIIIIIIPHNNPNEWWVSSRNYHTECHATTKLEHQDIVTVICYTILFSILQNCFQTKSTNSHPPFPIPITNTKPKALNVIQPIKASTCLYHSSIESIRSLLSNCLCWHATHVMGWEPSLSQTSQVICLPRIL